MFPEGSSPVQAAPGPVLAVARTPRTTTLPVSKRPCRRRRSSSRLIPEVSGLPSPVSPRREFATTWTTHSGIRLGDLRRPGQRWEPQPRGLPQVPGVAANRGHPERGRAVVRAPPGNCCAASGERVSAVVVEVLGAASTWVTLSDIVTTHGRPHQSSHRCHAPGVALAGRRSHDGPLEQKARHVRADRQNRVTVTTAEQAVELLVMLGATQDHAEWQVRTALNPPSITGEIHRQE